MRTGKIGLRQFLFEVGVPGIDSKYCDQCTYNNRTRDIQNTFYILFVCPAFADLRKQFRSNIRDSTTDLRKVLGDEKLATHAANFMVSTGLLKPFSYVQVEPEEEDAI